MPNSSKIECLLAQFIIQLGVGLRQLGKFVAGCFGEPCSISQTTSASLLSIFWYRSMAFGVTDD